MSTEKEESNRDGELARITICDLAYAYRLSYAQCRSMVENLQTYFPYEVGDIAELDELAEAEAATGIPTLIDLVTAGRIIDIMRPELCRIYDNNRHSFTRYRDCKPIIEEAFKAVFLGLSEVNKKDAVIYLNEHGFTLANQVPGLSGEYVASLIADNEVQPEQVDAHTNKISINIPPSLFAGMDIVGAYIALKETYQDRRVMAAILQKIGGTKTEIGRLLYVPERDTGDDPEDSTYRRQFDKLGSADIGFFRLLHKEH